MGPRAFLAPCSCYYTFASSESAQYPTLCAVSPLVL
ncbi:hypothetical protein PENANT_c064G01008 [Penicillium antarcticum]|uniref:Uncharacterized protein n=1 Tax=Penicillium antarcticum TaxID=416450 RepID=A0A1V6PPZ1_9EURO|nr:hypothetical protein PENANT_c064G01008 [Penicillium antarcticum]